MKARVLRTVGSLLVSATLLFGGPKREENRRARGTGAPRSNRFSLRDFERLPPEQRRQALDQLPEKRRARVQEKLNRLRQMPPEQRHRLETYTERLHQLPQESQRRVRGAIHALRQLPADRQQAVREEFQRLSTMTGLERAGRLQSEQYRTLYSADERRTLADLSELSPQP